MLMDEKVSFDYFYGSEADAFSFYRIPKLLFTCDFFRNLSIEAKVLYGLMLDRMGLSVKNKWFDSDNRAYIYFSIEDAMELLNCGKNKAIKSMQELDIEEGIGLIEKRRQGMGKANIIYVKSFSVDQGLKFNNKTSSSGEDTEVYISNHSLEQNSRGLQIKLPEVYKEDTNKNIINNTESSNTKSNLILSDESGIGIQSAQSGSIKLTAEPQMRLDMMDEASIYSEIIKENIEYDILVQNRNFDKEILDGLFDLILETVLNKNETIVIASNEYSTNFVKGKMLKLTSSHIEYVIDCFTSNTTKVKNVKKYLLAALFNAPSTIGSYYQAEVNHDFPQYARTN